MADRRKSTKCVDSSSRCWTTWRHQRKGRWGIQAAMNVMLAGRGSCTCRSHAGHPMNSAIRSVISVAAATLAVLLGSVAASAQATVDAENSYPSVGAIMVWRVDDSGQPVELRGFASGTLIRPHVMITAGHFTAPAKALGELPPTIRIFASFSPTNARDPAHVDSGDRAGHASIDAALPAAAAMRSDRRHPGRSTRTRHRRRRTRVPRTRAGQHRTCRAGCAGHPREFRGRSHDDRRIRHHVTRASIRSTGRRLAMGRHAAYQVLGRAEDRR